MRGRQIPRQALPAAGLGVSVAPGSGSWVSLQTPFTPHSHTAPHSTLKPRSHTHGQHCTHCGWLTALPALAHSLTPHSHGLHTPLSLRHPTGLISSGRFTSLPLLPSLQGRRGTERKAAENQGEGWAEEGRGPSLCQLPRRYPINQSFTVQLGIPGAQCPT